MTTKRIVYEMDGVLLVVIPAVKAMRPEETEDAFLSRLVALNVPEGTPFVILNAADLPDRRFRACWEMISGRVTVNVVKAKGVVLENVRTERNRRIASSDALFARGQDTGPATFLLAVRQYRQLLRDLPDMVSLQIAGLDLAGLQAYVPPWPVTPEGV